MAKLKSVILGIIAKAAETCPGVTTHFHEDTVLVYWPKQDSEEHCIAVLEYEGSGYINCIATSRELGPSKYKQPQHRPIKSAAMTLVDPQLATKITQWITFLLEQLNKPVEAKDA